MESIFSVKAMENTMCFIVTFKYFKYFILFNARPINMKITQFISQDFQELSQLDKIEYLLRKEEVEKNIKKSFPFLEIILGFSILAFRALYNLSFVAAFGIDSSTMPFINLFSLFCNTLIVLFTISFIGRVIIYFQKHKQISELNDEFLDRIQVSLEIAKTKRSKK